MKPIGKSSIHRSGVQQTIARCALVAAGIMALGSRVGWCDAYFYARAGTNGPVEGWTPVRAPTFDRNDVVWTAGTRLLSASALAAPGDLAVSTRATVNINTIYVIGLEEKSVPIWEQTRVRHHRDLWWSRKRASSLASQGPTWCRRGSRICRPMWSTENLSPPVQWSEMTNIVARGRTNMLALDSSSGKRFFRLTR